MIHYLDQKKLDRQRYDACVAASVNASPYALSWYLDAVGKGRWGALVFGDYQAVFPFCYKSLMGLKLIYQPLFTQQLGLFSIPEAEVPALEEFLAALPSSFRKMKLSLGHSAKFSSNGIDAQTIDKSIGRRRIRHLRFTQEQGVTHHLKLDRPHSTLVKSYTENTRRNIRKAKKQGLIVSFPPTFSAFQAEEFMQILKENQAPKIKGLKESDYLRIPKLMKTCDELGAARFVRVEHEGKLVAGLFFLEGFDWLINLFGASSPIAHKTGAMALAMDAFIEANSSSDKTIDFEGSMVPGIARFYRGFGSEVVHFSKISSNKPLFLFDWLHPGVKLIDR